MGESSPKRRQEDGRLRVLRILRERKARPSRFPCRGQQMANRSPLASSRRSIERLTPRKFIPKIFDPNYRRASRLAREWPPIPPRRGKRSNGGHRTSSQKHQLQEASQPQHSRTNKLYFQNCSLRHLHPLSSMLVAQHGKDKAQVLAN